MSNPDAVAHLDRARERYEVATELLRAGHVDDAANRVYYAYFLAAKSLLVLKGMRPRTHRGVLHCLTEEDGDILSIDLLTSFRKSQRLRERADYEVMFKPTEESGEFLLEEGEKFLDFAEKTITAQAD